MVIILCALYQEAAPIIKHYGLKKNEYSSFSIYENEDFSMKLVITGVGRVSAATAVGLVAGMDELGSRDCLINFGLAAGSAKEEAGRLFSVNKLTEKTTGRTFYPDMLWSHCIDEVSLITVDEIVEELGAGQERTIYDMEATAIYQSAIHFVGPHQIGIIKMISDHGTKERLDLKYIEQLIEHNSSAVFEYIDEIIRIQELVLSEQFKLSEDERSVYNSFCKDIHCSTTMEREVYQHIKYCELSGNSMMAEIRKLYDEGRIPCKDKREGKVIFDEIKRAVIK